MSRRVSDVLAEDLPYGPGNPDYEYDRERQRKDDEAAEKRRASGFSPEQLSIQDAFMEGQRAGTRQLSPSLNPFQDYTPEHQAWERGRQGAASVAAARMVA